MIFKYRGFTLIEVLVALAVVVVAFLAMYGSAQQVVRATTLQQEKTFAGWVAFDQLTAQHRCGLFANRSIRVYRMVKFNAAKTDLRQRQQGAEPFHVGLQFMFKLFYAIREILSLDHLSTVI